jgi:hypothetical protein
VSIFAKAQGRTIILAKFCKHLAGEQDIGARTGDNQKAAIERKARIS